MAKKNTNAKKRGIFISLTREKSRKEIRRVEQKIGRHLKEGEKLRIIERNAKKVRIYTMIGISSFLLGGIGTNKLTKMLESGKTKTETEITIDADTYPDGINIENVKSDKEIFLNGIRVDLNEINHNEELEQSVTEEINNLKNSDEVLKYIKQIYVDEYNEKYNKNATIENVYLHKNRYEKLYVDAAQNGDKIIRKGIPEKRNDAFESTNGLLSAYVNYDGDYIEEVIYIGEKDGYKNVYDEYKVVENDEKTVLQDIGAIIEHGIDYYSGFVDEKESDIYKQRLIEAVKDYKTEKIKEIIKPNAGNEIEGEEIDRD